MGPRMWGRAEAWGPLLRAKEEQKRPSGPTPFPKTQGCVTAEALQAARLSHRAPETPPPPHSITAKGQDDRQGPVWALSLDTAIQKLQDLALVPRTRVPVVPIPAELREGTAGQVPRLGQGRQSGSVLGCRGQKRSAGGGAGQGGHRWEGRRRVCCLWSWNG